MKTGVTRQHLENWLGSKGWERDKYGYFQMTENGREYRFKLSSIAARYEVKVRYEAGGNDWVRLRSGYYKDLSFTEDNKLIGLK